MLQPGWLKKVPQEKSAPECRLGSCRLGWGPGRNAWFLPPLYTPDDNAVQQQNTQDRAVFQRFAPVGFDQPEVMDHAGDPSDVDQAMQALPVLATQAANPSRGRR